MTDQKQPAPGSTADLFKAVAQKIRDGGEHIQPIRSLGNGAWAVMDRPPGGWPFIPVFSGHRNHQLAETFGGEVPVSKLEDPQ